MLIFILKFSVCLAVLMLFYKVFLERSSMHHFKRFYLLGALVFAFIVPAITIIEYIEPTILTELDISESMPSFETSENIPIETPVNSLAITLWSVYGLGVLIFLLKFCRNLRVIVSRIKNNSKYKSGGFINVLVTKLITPHTFFNYIFLNKHKFENAEIPKEVMLHEQTHAKQLHSFDVFILEVVQIIFWFNPLLYVLKKDVKLNHEFLADRAVLKHGIQPSVYQKLLLTFSSSGNDPQLANAINYSSIKKRFTVMKTQTSKPSIWLRSVLLLPLLAILFYSFSERIHIERELIQPVSQSELRSDLELFLNEKGELFYDNQIIEIDDLARLYHLENEMNISITTTLAVKKEITSSTTKRIQDFLREQGLKKFSVCVTAEKDSTQEEASPKQITEYNTWAKKINTAMKKAKATNSTSAYPIVKKKDVEYYKHIYKDLMTEQQRKNAEPWPSFPPQPPPPPPVTSVVKGEGVKTGFTTINDKLHYFVSIARQTTYYNRKGFKVSKEGKTISSAQVNASDVIPGHYITKVYSGNEVFAEFKDNDPSRKDDKVDAPPPPPPVHESTLDFAIDLAKKNAKFHFENEEISSDKAIALLKKNPELNLLAKHTSTKQPLVYISKAPIALGKQQKSNEPVLLNGKAPIDDQIALSRNEMENLKLTLKDAKVTNFKLKIPGIKSHYNTGNQLNKASKSLIRKLDKGSIVQLFDIKNSKNMKVKPVIITITD